MINGGRSRLHTGPDQQDHDLADERWSRGATAVAAVAVHSSGSAHACNERLNVPR
ncbi:hypothetical protein ACH47Z_43830 [Streptomyces sp. NPDC020192]|uniref:hypothetical protein n=1 Tax=Streptomyces sp. NPDC020192 TaxID=3365066 RepID=UPI0037BBB53B